MSEIDFDKLERDKNTLPDYPENTDVDIAKVKWLDDVELFNVTSVWSMWWVLMHAIREILVLLRRLDNGRRK